MSLCSVMEVGGLSALSHWLSCAQTDSPMMFAACGFNKNDGQAGILVKQFGPVQQQVIRCGSGQESSHIFICLQNLRLNARAVEETEWGLIPFATTQKVI